MTAHEIETFILSRYTDIKIKNAYSERSLFYNPDNKLPNGVYFVTIKEKDGQNDKSSQLNREGIYRVSFPLTKSNYEYLFGEKPTRPQKGKIVDLDIDFKAVKQLMPHPIYAWMNFVCINNPDVEIWNKQITPLLDEAYVMVKSKFQKKVK